MGLLPSNIATSSVAVAERFRKLYRKLYDSFLKKDFIHTEDYSQDIIQLNARFAELEGKITTELTKLQVGLLAHTHVTIAPGSSTSPPVGPPYTLGFSPTKPISHKDVFLKQRGASLLAEGPATAPLGDGTSPEAIKANIQIKKNIGI